MERLTMKNGLCDMASTEFCLEKKDCCPVRTKVKCLKRLAAYEDTGLTPEEVVALQGFFQIFQEDAVPLVRANMEDRVVVLPCKVTDTVYIIETVFESGKRKKRNKPSGEQIVSAQIDHVTIGGTTGKPVFDLCSETGNWYYSMEPGEFYLTREEAEAAIAKRGDHT